MWNKLSMNGRLQLVIVGISLLGLTTTLVISKTGLKALREGKEAQVRSAVSSLTDKIDRNLFERYGDVQAFALSEPARSVNAQRIMAFMDDMMTAYAPIYDLMMVTDKHGRVIAVNRLNKDGQAIASNGLLGADLSSETWFQSAIRNEIKPGSAFVEDLHVDGLVAKTLSNSGKVMNFTAPIRDKVSGEVIGVWTNRMSWSSVVEDIVRIESKELKTGRIAHVFASLMDQKGTYLVHPQGADFELKKSNPRVAELASQLDKGVSLTADHVDYPGFSGEAINALVRSRGYSTYPGLGWVASFEVPESDSQKAANYTLIAISILCMAFGSLIGYFVIVAISRTFGTAILQLRKDSLQIRSAAGETSSASENLAQTSSEQAAALQQTSSAIEEMNAMVKTSAESAQRSGQVAQESQEAASRGKKSVEKVVEAIQQIEASNSNIMAEVNESNRQISEIVQVIAEIGNKTKVINEIVFQTKLLSFNASVEAARAGEHGKGFAVVAEEVGNLAQMSGAAAQEISDLLDASMKKVEAIVATTKSRVEALVSEGKSKVEAGTLVAGECDQILDDVVTNAKQVAALISEITVASREQAQGISEITQAINELNTAIQTNATTSQQTAQSAESLEQQSESLTSVVTLLDTVVHGSRQKEEAKVFTLDSHPRKLRASAPAVAKLKVAGKQLGVPAESDSRFSDV